MSTEDSSSLEIKDVSKADLEKLRVESDLGTCVRVTDDKLRYLILLDEYNGVKIWRPFDGRDKEGAIRRNEWYKNGQKMLSTGEKIDRDTLDRLNQVLLAISTLAQFFSWDDKTLSQIIDEAITQIAYEFFCKATGYDGKLEDLATNEEFLGYLNMAAMLASTFARFVASARAAVTKDAQEAPPESGDEGATQENKENKQ